MDRMEEADKSTNVESKLATVAGLRPSQATNVITLHRLFPQCDRMGRN